MVELAEQTTLLVNGNDNNKIFSIQLYLIAMRINVFIICDKFQSASKFLSIRPRPEQQ